MESELEHRVQCMESQLQGVTEKGWWQCVEDVQHSVHLAGVICVVVIILSRGAKGRISLGLCHYLVWSQPATQPRYGANITAASEQDI